MKVGSWPELSARTLSEGGIKGVFKIREAVKGALPVGQININ